ncbi:MAG: hypothetical protein KGP29_00525 [Proteobacteria bacterium]|nr:hypothetical protein [Pseudomonadota bacterium]
MNFGNPETTKITVKNSTAFVVLLLVFLAIFFAPKTSSSPPNQDCSAVIGTPQAGDNCLYFYPLPLCSAVPRAGWIIPSSSILEATTNPNHRVNCADLADLPLCNQLEDNGVTAYPLKNCVKECSDITGSGNRGIDYAVHNRDCIRFCGDVEEGVTTSGGDQNCVAKNCHQIEYNAGNPSASIAPNPTNNCNLLPCNLLTTNELNEAKFTNEATINYEYCKNENKCLDFAQTQLPYLIPNKSCKMHNCRVSCIDNATDDVQKIKDKGVSYTNDYQNYINSNYQIGTESDTLCQRTFCQPVIKNPLHCFPENNPEATIRNEQCDDPSTPGGICSGGYCYKTIDCNSETNNSLCQSSSTATVGSTEDSSVKSWFYRPKPMDSATNGSGVPRNFDADRFCYSKDNMLDNNWGEDAYITTIFGRIPLGYWHPFWEDPRSPGKCSANNIGVRGVGPEYLCGMNLNIYNKPNSYAGYHSGYTETTFNDIGGTSIVSVCLRFDAGGAIGRSCGKRECQVSCAFGECNQICGSDECVTLVVKEEDADECTMTNSLSAMPEGDSVELDGTTRECMKTIDEKIRIRAVRFDDYICTFLDIRGTFAYSPIYFDGSEKITLGGETPDTADDKTYCFSGTYDESTRNCNNSKNSNDAVSSDQRWRAIMQIPYIQNNQPSGEPRGYLDKNGRLFPEQGCIKIGHRITVPRLYNLANIENSPRIFTPPLYILNASTKRGGAISIPSGSQTFGDTDFHYPEITINFGSSTQKLSLGFGKTGYEESSTDIDPLSNATISTAIDGDITESLSAEVMVRKEFENASNRPTFCLYQKIKDENQTYLTPQRIGCVYRKYPEIDNSRTRLSSDNYYKLVLSSDTNNSYSSSKIVIRYLSSSLANASCESNPSSCSTPIILGNDDPSLETCDPPTQQSNSISVEQNKICVRRDECNKLNNECIQNEINLHNARATNQSIDSLLTIQNYCNRTLLPICNNKFGINTSNQATVYNPNPSGATGDNDAYGWFNELCITQGFEQQKKRVVAKLTDNGVMGKCVIDGVTAADCSAGGKKPDCPCLEYVNGTSLAADQYDRLETSHEAGLCIDIPLPQVCPAINHNLIPNTIEGDENYIYSSLLQEHYGNDTSQSTNVVHISHRYRTEGLLTNDGVVIPIAGHAEFPQAIFGFNDVTGRCEGFWDEITNSEGVKVPPTMSCLYSAGSAIWGEVSNPCVRYSCPLVDASQIDPNGSYPNGYGASETGENKGSSHGFANWPETSLTSDFAVDSSATSCVTGFKKANSSIIISNSSSPISSNHSCAGDYGNANRAALYSCISGYSGGASPTRKCNQTGSWQTPENYCQRISCPAINPPTPSGSDDTASWELWSNSGGATFPSVNAARSETLVDGSIVKLSATSTGTCNNDLGFFQISGGPAPTRVCDYLGNWSAVENPCITKCNAISTSTLASSEGNGHAYWYEAINIPVPGELLSTSNGCSSPSNPPNPQFTDNGVCKTNAFNGCVDGYFTYPYPPLRNAYGTAYTLGNCKTETCPAGTIPKDVNNDTRAVGNPERYCKSINVVSSASSEVNVWTSTSSSCVNSCPGYDVDPRINVGKTEHPASNNADGSFNGTLTINWPTTAFGQTAYINSPSDINTHNGSHYYYGRTNGYYSLSRYCNPNTHKWENPTPYCATNNGQIKVGPSNIADALATYNSPTPRVAVGSTTGTGTCLSGSYSDANGSISASAATCSYKDANANNRIDETYFDTGSVKKCNPMCRSRSGDNYGNGSTDATSGVNYKYYVANSRLNLNCRDGYGSTIISGSSVNNSYNSCNRSNYGATSDRSPNQPYTLCTLNSDGSASWSTILNDCSLCRSCSRATSSIIPNNNSVGNGDSAPSQSKVFSGEKIVHFYSSGQENCGSNDDARDITDFITNKCSTSSWFSLSHGQCVRMGFTRGQSCRNSAGQTRHTDTNAYFDLVCSDGVYVPDTNASACSGATNNICERR